MTERSIAEITRKVRRNLVKLVWSAGGGHIGGSLSAVDLLTVLYFRKMKVDPKRPQWEERDRLVLSKGHAGAALYTVLAEKGYFAEDLLYTDFDQVKGILPEHPDRLLTPGVDMTSGSLGQGLSVGAGMAWALRRQGKSGRVFILLGCGEMQEGQIWEAAMAVPHHKLTNLVAIIDYNRLQLCGNISQVMEVEPLADKWRAFGWRVKEIDGHNPEEIEAALASEPKAAAAPLVIIAHTIKGKGVSFVEGNFTYHAATLKEAEYLQAMEELKEEAAR